MATTKEEVKKPAVKKAAKPKKVAVAASAPAPKAQPRAASKPKSSASAIDKLVEAEAKIAGIIKSIEADCQKGAGLTGLQRREHNRNLNALAEKLSRLLA